MGLQRIENNWSDWVCTQSSERRWGREEADRKRKYRVSSLFHWSAQVNILSLSKLDPWEVDSVLGSTHSCSLDQHLILLSHGAKKLPPPLTSKVCFHHEYFQRKIMASLRQIVFSHRKHEKEGSWHLGTRVKNSVFPKLEFYLMFLGKKPSNLLYIVLHVFKGFRIRPKKKTKRINNPKKCCTLSYECCFLPPHKVGIFMNSEK